MHILHAIARQSTDSLPYRSDDDVDTGNVTEEESGGASHVSLEVLDGLGISAKPSTGLFTNSMSQTPTDYNAFITMHLLQYMYKFINTFIIYYNICINICIYYSNRLQCIYYNVFITMRILQCIYYNAFITMHLLQCIYYNAYITMHILQCIYYNAYITMHLL